MEQISTNLIRAIKKGNQKAFKTLFLEYQDPIYAYALKFLKSRELAEELVQEVFMRVWKYREKLDEQGQINAYLYTIARNRIYQQLKNATRDKALRAALFARDQGAEPVLETEFDHQELLEVYTRAVEMLPAQRKKVFQMSRNEQLTHEEIAHMLDISKNTVKDQVSKASRFIRKYILIHQ